MIWFGWVLWHINHCRLFNAKSSLYVYIKYIWFGLVEFHGISTIVGYLMPNSIFTYILNIWFVSTFYRCTGKWSSSHLFALSQIVLFDQSSATSLGQSGHWDDGNEGVLCIPQSSSPSDCCVINRTFVGGRSYPSAEMQSIYSTAPAD